MKNHKKSTVIFLHIPKTAGTTLHHILKRQYKPSEIYTADLWEPEEVQRFADLTPSEKSNFKIIWGHLSYGFHKYIPGESTYFTFLRNPVDRVISHYYYHRSRPDIFVLPESIEQEDLSFHDVIERDLIVDIQNIQTRLLAGLPYNFPANQYKEEHLEAAKANLRERFSVIGLVERFDESLLMMKNMYGWDDIYYKQHNVTSSRPGLGEISKETIELIEQKNELDVKLYEFAKEEFVNQLAKLPFYFGAQLKLFELWNNKFNEPVTKVKHKLNRFSLPFSR